VTASGRTKANSGRLTREPAATDKKNVIKNPQLKKGRSSSVFPVHRLKGAVEGDALAFHFGEFSVSKTAFTRSASAMSSLFMFSMHGDNGKRYALCAEKS